MSLESDIRGESTAATDWRAVECYTLFEIELRFESFADAFQRRQLAWCLFVEDFRRSFRRALRSSGNRIFGLAFENDRGESSQRRQARQASPSPTKLVVFDSQELSLRISAPAPASFPS